MEALKNIINFVSMPEYLLILSIVLFALSMIFVRKVATKSFGIALALFSTVFFVAACMDKNFLLIVSKPDNVPIVIMLVLVGFFTWLSLRLGVINDDRIAAGNPPVEGTAEGKSKTIVWPDLVYIELICLVLVLTALIVWSIVLKAPLEEPANPNLSPNPAKAPWYFLGLQEMLVYFDPWIAGVLLPGFIVVGLMAIPYIDYNKKGNGYYTFKERKFAIVAFLFGFLILWVVLILIGTFVRGPNWDAFGIFEVWDANKKSYQPNVQLADFMWQNVFKTNKPEGWFLREIFGIVVVLLYFTAVPFVLTKTVFKTMRQNMNLPRYSIMMLLLLTMSGLVIKMVLRWIFTLKYIVNIHESFFNI